MICKYCGKDKELVESHVIPKAFFKRQRHGQGPLKMLTEHGKDYPKRLPAGVYDRMLCGQCEQQFGDWDNYAQNVLKEPPDNASPVTVGSQIVGYEIAEYSYKLLKLFFISLLWRASVSVHEFYEKISLGPYIAAAKQCIDRQDPGSPEEFSVFLARFDHPLGGTILDPHLQRIMGINFYRFYLGNYVAYIKVDKRETPEPCFPLVLSPNEPLKIVSRNMERGGELSLIKEMVAASTRTR